MAHASTSHPAGGGTPRELEHNLIERVCVGDIVTRAADVFADRPAIIDGNRTFSFRELNRQANRLGHALLGLGLKHGDVVGVMARNCAEVLITYFGCAKAGLVCAPVNLGLRGEEIAYCLRDARARVLIVDGALVEAAKGLPAHLPELDRVYCTGDVQADIPKSAGTFASLVGSGGDAELEVLIGDRDPVQLLYTSGTTAKPKGVVASHLAVTICALSSAIANRSTPESSILVTLPLFHCALLNGGSIPALTVGAAVVLMPAFDAARAAELIERHRIRTTVFLPVMYAALLADPAVRARNLSSVTRAIYAMAPMPQERLKAIHDLFPSADVVLGSGQTEFTPPNTYQRPEHQWNKAGSWGPPTSMTRAAIMSDDGRLLPRGEVGELVYRGPQVMSGYLNQPQATDESFRHGWFHSGDIAWMDEEGVIWFTDRKKDMIKTGGENVASIEVERCLMEHPAVAEAAALGLPHARWGEAVTAMVVLKPGAQADEATLLAHARDRLAGFKVPKAILFEKEFPRTGTGKIQKHVMRERLRNLYANADAADAGREKR
ncbi:MAG: AMP-binding protein [Sulfurifustis sp.]